jgi:hypothetical protein
MHQFRCFAATRAYLHNNNPTRTCTMPIKHSVATRDKFFHFRLTQADIDQINRNAAQAGMRPGVFVRELALSGGNMRVVSRVDQSAVFELRRLGAMLKNLYPKNSTNWTNEEKRRHWDAMKAVLEHADRLADWE